MLEAVLRAAWAVGGGILAPGACVVLAANLGRGRLEPVLLSLAFGQLLLAGVTILATAAGVAGAMPAWGVLSIAACTALHLRTRSREARPALRRIDARTLVAALVPVAASLLMVFAVTARSGITDAQGALVFRDDPSADLLFYLSVARDLAATGLPLGNPFASDFPLSWHLGQFGALAGVQLVGGGDWFDLAFRVVPLVNTVGLALTGFALVRALGGSLWGASIGATLLVIGGDLSWPVTRIAAALGIATQDLNTWAMYFGPVLVPVNPASTAMQAVFAACLLVVRMPEGGTRSALATGALFAGVVFFKVPSWAPFAAALALLALRPPPAHARWLRIAAVVAIVASLPAHIDSLLRMTESARLVVGFHPCPGCLPQFQMDVTFRGLAQSFARFETFRWADLLSLREWLAIAGASLALTLIGLGARLLALPELWRGCRFGAGPPDGRSTTYRLLLAAAVLGMGAASTIAFSPYYPNGLQFAWGASFPLWLVLGVAAGRWLAVGRRLPVVLVLLLALAHVAQTISDRAWTAPVAGRVSAQERALLEQLAAVSQPDDVVLEPSWFDQRLASPVPWLAGRQVYLTAGVHFDSLPKWEQLLRVGNVHHVFVGERSEPALAALESTKAHFVYAPAAWPLRFDPGDALEEIARNEAGVIYRVRSRAGKSGG